MLYLYYQSLGEWTEAQGIMYASPKFEGRPRYDCAVLNVDNGGSRDDRISLVHLQGMYRYKLRSGKDGNIALAKLVKQQRYVSTKPDTLFLDLSNVTDIYHWHRCRVLVWRIISSCLNVQTLLLDLTCQRILRRRT